MIGRCVGSVRLVESLGAGGAGEVYLGIDERLDRRVAVKAIRGEAKPDGPSRARLLREARVLSQLEHPNICRLYEYVQDEDSDFLVLELVEGRTLQTVIADGGVPPDAMALAEQIVRALVAAHAMMVVHRDLKPANIMVTEDRQVKVLDFGLARAIRGEPDRPGMLRDAQTAKGLRGFAGKDVTVTQDGAIPGTPRYMSPEQARGERVTASGDIYSLGLVLQELFTGVKPMEDTEDIVALYQKAMWGENLPVEGVGRDIRELIEACKSLNSDDRPSAEGVAERLRWIREAPVRRVRKIVALGFVGILVVATAVSTVGFVRARKAQTAAENSAIVARQAQAESESVASFLEEMLASADPGVIGRDVRVIDVLDEAAERLSVSFGETPLRKATVALTLGRTYRGLGLFGEARRLFEQAESLRSDILGPEAPETLEVRHLLGSLARDQGRLEEATEVLRSVFESRREVLGPDSGETLETQSDLAVTLGHRRQFEEAAVLAEDILERRRRSGGKNAEETLSAEYLLARIYAQTGRYDEGEALAVHAVGGFSEILGPAHPKTLGAVNALSRILGFQGRTGEAETLVRNLVDQTAEVLGPDHPKALEARSNLAVYLMARGEFSQAADILRVVIEDQERVLDPAHPSILSSMKNLGWALDKTGRQAEAIDLSEQRYKLALGVYGPRHRITLECRSGLASGYLAAGRFDEAEAIYRETLAIRREIFGPNHGATIRSLRDLAKALRGQGRGDEAAEIEAERDRLMAQGVTAG